MTCTYPSCMCLEVHALMKQIDTLATRMAVDLGPERRLRLASTMCDYHRRWDKEVDTRDRCQGSNFNLRGWGRS